MNIWCISKYASPPNYGTGARLFYLTKEFIKLGEKATLFTSDSNHLAKFPETNKSFNYEEIENVPTYWFRTKKYIKTASIARILSWFDFEKLLFKFDKNKLEKPDVVIVSSLSIFSIFYLKKKYNAFLVFEIRDIWPLTMTEEGNFSKLHPLVLFIGWIEKFGYKKSDLIVGTMPKLDIHVKNILGYDKEFFCSPLGFNPKNYADDFLDKKSPFDKLFPKNKMVIGYAGSMGLTNALEPFIKAIQLLNDNNKIHFMLVGSGDLKNKFEEQLQNCSNVTFLSRIEQTKVKYFLKKCDVLYLSTKDSKVWEFGQSMNKVVEYMLSAKPIIASYTGYPSMINEANCGEFVKTTNAFDVKEAILNIAKLDSNERLELGNNGKKWIYQNRQYSLLAKEYIKKIKNLMDKKNIFDKSLALFLIIVFSPIYIVVSILILYKMGSPIFFRQKRPGKNGLIFGIYKFRTMTNDTDENGEFLPDEQRLVAVGKFIRSTSLDELPQLLNVLKGEMSFVGPRPLLIEYLDLYNDEQKRRHNIKPGITGWAQVNGRNAISWEQKFEHDVWYVDNQSFFLDMKILWLTFLRVVKRSDISSSSSSTMEKFNGNK